MSLIVESTFQINRVVHPGCSGFRHLGFPAGGPADEKLAGIALGLAGLRDGIVLEISGPCKFRSDSHGVIGIGCWKGGFELDGEFQHGFSRVSLKAGQTVQFESVVGTAYLAGITVEKEAPTQPMRAGDQYDFGFQQKQIGNWRIAEQIEFDLRHLKWIPRFDFAEVIGEVTMTSRMGIRVKSNLDGVSAAGVSEASGPGIVQLTPDGTILIHGVDGPTIGGYEKIGSIARSDQWKLGQLKPTDRVVLQPVQVEEAILEWEAEKQFRDQLFSRIEKVFSFMSSTQ